MKLWHRYVAVGDSFTEGMSDPDPRGDDSYLGWADRLAVALAQQNAKAGESFDYANLAVRGRLLDDVVGPQLDAALEMSPDLVSIVGGGNDVMRPNVDLDALADQLEEAVIRIRATGADVLLSTMANPEGSRVLATLRPRISWYAAEVWGIAQRHDAHVIDLWTMRALRDPRMWGTDRLHLSTEGHTRVAQQAAFALGLPTTGDWLELLPPRPPRPTRERLAENVQWTKEYFGPWVQRRLKGTSSGDGRVGKRPAPLPIDVDALPRSVDDAKER